MFTFAEGLAVSMMGPQLSNQLRLRKTVWRNAPILLRGLIPLWELTERVFPPSKKLAQFHGTNLWLAMAEFPPQGGLEMFAAARDAVDD
jgi:hypothetical protein